MNEALQNLEIKVENGGTTPQGRLTSSEWNILVAAVKALDADSDDPSQLEAYLKPYAKTADVASTYATIASLSAVTSRLNDFLAGSDIDAIINKWSELETFLAGLTETDNLATILSGKANKATTLTGYGITDAYTKSHIDSNFVTIGTKQRITGEKDFVGGLKVNGGLVEYNATLKAWVFNGDLLVTGGMAAFSNISGFKPSTITDAVLIDDRTIKRNADGLLYAVPQGAGGINEDQLEEYLRPYATQDWVTGKGYITDSASIKGNAATATKLATIRFIFGQSFDGSAEVSGNIFPINTSGCYYNENGINYHTNKQYQASILRVTPSYNVAIGGTTASEKLEVHGGAIVRENLTMGIDNSTTAQHLFRMYRKVGTTRNRLLMAVLDSNDIEFSYYDHVSVYKRLVFGTHDFQFLGGSVAIGGETASEKLEVYGNVKATSFIGSLSGNADSATTLKTSTGYVYARTFNVDKIVDIGADATFQGYSTYIDGMSIRFRYGSANATAMQIGTDGKLVIGGTTASEKLHVYGNILASGGVTATNSSDERLKRNIRKFNASEVLMSLGGIYEYEYIDSEVRENHIYEGTHYGLIYQHVKGTKLDVMCHEREDGFGTLNYIHPKFISLIAGATMENISEVEKLKRKIRHLENKVKQLEQRA